MTIEYAHRIAEAAGLDIDLDCKGIGLQDKLYGLFQCFIPYGASVRAVFAPLQNGTELQARISRSTQANFLKPYFELYLARRQIAFEHGEVVVFAH